MNTVFNVNGQNIEVAGVGQETCSAVLNVHPYPETVILMGFNNPITNKFTPVKL